MATHARTMLGWTAAVLLLVEAGCASRSVPVSRPPGIPPEGLAQVSDADRQTCEAYARRRRGDHDERSVAGPVLLGIVSIPVGAFFGAIGALGGRPEGFFLPVIPFEMAAKNAQANRAIRDRHAAALKSCLEPILLERTLGPGHPEVAWSLTTLAGGYAELGEHSEAASLFQRALDARERASGPAHPELAPILEGYAAVLRRLERVQDAEAMEARLAEIRAAQKGGREGATPRPDQGGE